MNYFPGRAKFFLTALFAVLLSCPALAASPAVPAPGSYVNDYAGVMDPQAVAKLNGVLAELDSKAKAQVAVLTVKSLGGADLESYAVETYKKWGVGDKKTSRGVLLLVAVEDRKSRIEVGYGLEGLLPDGLTGSVQDKYMVPYFKAGDYSTGISQGALALAARIAEDSGVTLSAGFDRRARPQPQLPPLTRGQKIFLLLAIIGFILFSIKHPYLALFLLHAMMRGSGRGGHGGGGGFGAGGGFGGFGGGSSGGGGSSRSW